MTSDTTPDRAADRRRASDLVLDASTRLVRTVDGFHGDDWSAPTLLPSWSRAHVVAHLALNAEGMARALRGVVADDADDEPRSMYDSDQQRDQDIAVLATADASEIRERLLAGTTLLNEAVAAIPEDRWDTRVERTPGGREIRADAFPGMRLRELEIHHVDLDAGYTTAAWPLPFAEYLLDAMTKRLRLDRAVEIRPLDSSRTWVIGDGEAEYPVPVVTGPAADLGWWLTGRPAPTTVSCSQGELPSIEGW
jgi:maleylpyruvate isomerase